jgi:HSP20 family protein
MLYTNHYFELPKVCHPKSGTMAQLKEQTFRPKMNVQQTDEQIIIEFALAGVSKEEVRMNIENRILNFEANRKSTEIEKGEYEYREFGPVTFKTKIQLPDDVVEDSIQAQFNNGVLIVSIKKEKKQNIQIEIK